VGLEAHGLAELAAAGVYTVLMIASHWGHSDILQSIYLPERVASSFLYLLTGGTEQVVLTKDTAGLICHSPIEVGKSGYT